MVTIWAQSWLLEAYFECPERTYSQSQAVILYVFFLGLSEAGFLKETKRAATLITGD
jgi:hypothetical protein